MIKVIGVDPAPGKQSCVCDPNGIINDPGKVFMTHEHGGLYAKLRDLSVLTGQIVLIAWDAPLTAKREIGSNEVEKGDFTMRDIEKKYRSESRPNGISVQPYCGAPHWTFSQFCLGLPNVGGAMRDAKPLFPLITGGEALEIEQTSVVETHPAVALYYWLKDTDYANGFTSENAWKYKGTSAAKRACAVAHAKALVKWHPEIFKSIDVNLTGIKNDDELDAGVAYFLARTWASALTGVKIVGSRTSGAWLLPDCAPDL